MQTVVHYVDSTAYGGTEKIALDLLANLDRSRWRSVLLYHPEPGLRPLLDGVKQAGLEARTVPRIEGRFRAVRSAQFAAALHSMRTAVFHAHQTWQDSCRFALLTASLARVPAVVATLQVFAQGAPQRRPLSRRLIARSVDRYIAVSGSLQRRLQDDLLVPPEKIRVVHNAVPLGVFDCRDNSGLRRALLPDECRHLVLTPARLHEQKGLQYLVEAAAQVPETVFAVAGDGPERAALERQAKAAGVADRVLFLGHREDIPSLLAACDLFVLPSLFEGFPVSVLEAAAAGKPVVATAVEGTVEAVWDGETGVLVPPADAAGLAGAIRALLADPSGAARLATAARARVRQGFGLEAMVHRVAEIYDEVLSPHGR